jgi:Ni,Fe-hydrogenase I cytochrome b subunit
MLPSQNAVSVREVFRLPVRNVRLRTVMAIVVLFVLGLFGAYTFVHPRHKSLRRGESGSFSHDPLQVLRLAGCDGQ